MLTKKQKIVLIIVALFSVSLIFYGVTFGWWMPWPPRHWMCDVIPWWCN